MNKALINPTRSPSDAPQRSRILIAADDPAEALSIAEMLKDAEYADIHVTTDLREIVPFVNAKAFDLLIIDMDSELEDSALLIHRLPHEAVNTDMATLALVGPDHDPSRLAGLTESVSDTLCRPVRREDLIGKVQALFRPPLESFRL